MDDRAGHSAPPSQPVKKLAPLGQAVAVDGDVVVLE